MTSTQHLIPPETFLQKTEEWVVLDARSPGEFAKGHIPHAINVPLLRDEERAAVGTTYKKQSRQEAVLLGWELVGPRMREIAETLLKHAENGPLLIYCARGGMRSGILANMVQYLGLPISRLEGGYKAFRSYIRSLWEQPHQPVVILGGMTGTGKTEFLHHLAEAGESMLDLEGLANHRGSAFGAYGQPPQPTQQMFENLIGWTWSTFPPGQPVWIESESIRIGKVRVPDSLWERMRPAPVVELVVSMKKRMERLLRDYGDFEFSLLAEAVEKIRKRLGNSYADQSLAALEQGEISACFAILLEHYYDHCYKKSLSRRDTVLSVPADGADISGIVEHIKAAGRQLLATPSEELSAEIESMDAVA